MTKLASFAAACGNPKLRKEAPARSARYILFIDVLILFSSGCARVAAPFVRETAKSENRIGLVNRIAVSIHHVVKFAGFYRAAFIFSEWKGHMVNRWLCSGRCTLCATAPA